MSGDFIKPLFGCFCCLLSDCQFNALKMMKVSRSDMAIASEVSAWLSYKLTVQECDATMMTKVQVMGTKPSYCIESKATFTIS